MIEYKIVETTAEAIRELWGQTIEPKAVGIEKTNKEFAGDFTIVVFPYLKFSRKSPEATATELGSYLQSKVAEIEHFNVINGFLNLEISAGYWLKFVKRNFSDLSYGIVETRSERPVVLEYSSPNTNKPLHLGHIRNNLLGFSIAEILMANGYHVIRVNLVNDRGIHICKSMLAYAKWGNGETPASSGIKGDHLIGKYYVLFDKMYKEQIAGLVSQGISQENAERNAPLILEAQEILRKWESKDEETVALWKLMNGWAYDGFDVTYRRLGISFEKIYYESCTYLLGKELVYEGLEKGAFYRKDDGSIWVDLTNEGLDEKLLLRSDGTSVYMTQDIGTAQLRYDDFIPQKMIYVVGNEQNYHFDVLKKVLARLSLDYAGNIQHLSYGMVELPHGRMKSREGTVVDADDLMDDMYSTAEEMTRELGKANELSEAEAHNLFSMIGLGALKYFILKVDPKKNMLFDPKESIDFNGNTGPFIQYTYARIQSLINKGSLAGFNIDENGIETGTDLLPLEKELVKKLYQFPAALADAAAELSPAVVANFIYDLSKTFNQFYQELPVLKEENSAKVYLRLVLASFTGRVILKGMKMLGISVPERM